jgi:uncharacterized membrane protein HdeD (DUF308 family)
MYEYCDLRWGSITVSGFFSLLIGIAMLFFPRVATGLIVVFTALIILVLAGILIAEGLFLDTPGIPRWGIAGTGVLGLLLGALAILFPDWVILTAGIVIGGCLIIFGGLMLFAAASIIFDFLVRTAVAFSSMLAILVGIYFIFAPATGLEIFVVVAASFLIIYGVIRLSYGIRLRSWQKTCPLSYLERNNGHAPRTP